MTLAPRTRSICLPSGQRQRAAGSRRLGGGGRDRSPRGDVSRPARLRDPRRPGPDAARTEPATHVHVATEEGEAFAVRHEGLAMVSVADRFTLSSLMIFDMRAVLRDLTRESPHASG